MAGVGERSTSHSPFGTNVINRHSHCIVSICELAQPPGQPLDFPFIGAATMRVHNVAPGDDGVLHVRFEIIGEARCSGVQRS